MSSRGIPVWKLENDGRGHFVTGPEWTEPPVLPEFDARLIAAAPQLLEAALMIMGAWGRWTITGEKGRFEDVMTLVQRAATKAMGTTKIEIPESPLLPPWDPMPPTPTS